MHVSGVWTQTLILLQPGGLSASYDVGYLRYGERSPRRYAATSVRHIYLALRYKREKSLGKSLVHDKREQVRPKAQQHQQEETVLDGYGGNL